MKKIIFCLCLILTEKSFAAGWETITGNGNVKKESRNAADYTAVSLSGNVNIELTYGNAKNITIEADENLLPYIETKVTAGKLEVKTKNGYNLKSRTRMTVYISLTKLTSARLSGSGNITGRGSFTNSNETAVSVSGSGNINLAFERFDKINVTVSGSGNVTLKGNSSNSINAQVSGSGNIDCSTVKTSDVSAHISGSGNIKVYATQSIDAKVAGSGSVYYKGEASKVNSKTSGSGKVVKA